METRICMWCDKGFIPSSISLIRERKDPKGFSAKFCSIQHLNKYKVRHGIGNTGQFKKGGLVGDKNPRWVGDKIGYWGVHDWIYKTLGQPLECENCFINNDPYRKYQWANLSGKYLRDISDWARLCHICHHLIDDRTRALRQAQQRPVREKLANNKSGYKNVFQEKRNGQYTGKYIPYIRVAKRKQKWLGRFDTAAEAYEVYKTTALEMYGIY